MGESRAAGGTVISVWTMDNERETGISEDTQE